MSQMSITQFTTTKVLKERLASLARELSTHADALALLALGSVGRETERMDVWSDLDFFVLVRDGTKRVFVENIAWLAAAHPLAWHFQNTVDGHKALMTDGVFCEFAIFEIHELASIPYSPGRFVWRRSEVDESLASPKLALPARRDPAWLVGEALSNLIVGLQRHARGERLAAMRMVQVYALDRVLEFLERQQSTSEEPLAARDVFNVDRRVELRIPQATRALPRWAGGYEETVSAALALLAALDAHGVVPAGISQHVRLLAASAQRRSESDA
jgi:lincosamide nucleotidyltransferase B/F